MIAVDGKGNELLDIIDVSEADADKKYEPVNHCLVVVKIGDDYLMGWNNWRKDWERKKRNLKGMHYERM